MPSSAGGFPWKVDGGYNTIVYIKNETDIARKYTVSLLFDGGGGYSHGVRELKPKETVAIDFKKLRDEQTEDVNGNTIPLNIETGQIAWSSKGPDNRTTSGRSEQVNETLGIASTYACYNECMDSYSDGWVEPDWESIFPENSVLLTAYQQDTNHYGGSMPAYPVLSANWESGNPSAVSVNPSGEAYGVSGGVATITASWWADLPTGGEACQYYSDLIEKEAFVAVTVPNVTNVSSDENTYKITNILGNQNLIHFVTPKGSGSVSLTVALSESSPEILSDISWEGATESLSDARIATLSRSAASKNIVKIKYKGHVLKEFRVWAVWATITATHWNHDPNGTINTQSSPVFLTNVTTGTPPGCSASALGIKGGYAFTHTISPGEIITDTNRPDFSGTNTTTPPGGTNPWNGLPYSGGANKKWDASRQFRWKVLNPHGIATADTSSHQLANFPSDQTSYPSNDVEGNDDVGVVDENNDPYTNNTKVLMSYDAPISALCHRAGIDNNTFEWRYQFMEFTRLEIEGTWYRISDYYPWRLHMSYNKINGFWNGTNTSKALDNSGF